MAFGKITVWPIWPAIRIPVGSDVHATLMEDIEVDVEDGPAFVIPNGFQTDGASIPRFLWRLCGYPLQAPRIYAAIVHDYLYSGFLPVSRAEADDIYRRLLVQYGWGSWKARIEYLALRMFGASHYKESEE